MLTATPENIAANMKSSIDQENQIITEHVEVLDIAQDEWIKRQKELEEATRSGLPTDRYEETMLHAQEVYNQIALDLAKRIAALWRIGHRLK